MKKNGIRARLIESQLHELVGDRFGEPLRVKALSKVNLRLKVVGRRPDGYHLLSMLNCSTSLCDDVQVCLLAEPNVSLTIQPEGIISEDPASNLAVRAFRAFWRAFDFEGAPLGASISLQKRIPVGAGLGGGSSDAAAVLRILSGVFKTFLQADFGLSDSSFQGAIVSAALACGADVPYALTGGLCRVTGVGEVVEPIAGLEVDRYSVLIGVPTSPVPTRAFYERYRQAHPEVACQRDEALEAFVAKPSRGLTGLIENDFEADVVAMAPEVGKALSVVREEIPALSGVTGSGCAVFALISEREQGKVAALTDELKRQGCAVYQERLATPESCWELG